MTAHAFNSRKLWQGALLFCLAGSGLAVGYFIPATGSDIEPLAQSEASLSVSAEEAAPQQHRFPLTGFDQRDSIQAVAMATDGAASIWLAWESLDDPQERSLWFTRSLDQGRTFETPRRLQSVPVYEWDVVVRGNASKRASRIWPHLQYADGCLFVGWVRPDPEDYSQLTIQLSRSWDQGETFEEPIQLSLPEAVRPTFVDLAVGADQTISASWLDNRNGVQQPFASMFRENQLMESLVFPGQQNRGICPCCNTATLLHDGVQYVAFRNQFNGYRDMWLAKRSIGESEFETPIPIAGNRWEFNGCPHDGPSLAIHNGQFHAVWMDAHSGAERIYHAQAEIGDWQFQVQPISPHTPGTQGHPFVQIDRRGTLHVVWDESLDSLTNQPASGAHHHGTSGSGRVIFYAFSTDSGETFSEPHLVNPISGAFQTRPALACLNDGTVAITWAEQSEMGKEMVLHLLPAQVQP